MDTESYNKTQITFWKKKKGSREDVKDILTAVKQRNEKLKLWVTFLKTFQHPLHKGCWNKPAFCVIISIQNIFLQAQ